MVEFTNFFKSKTERMIILFYLRLLRIHHHTLKFVRYKIKLLLTYDDKIFYNEIFCFCHLFLYLLTCLIKLELHITVYFTSITTSMNIKNLLLFFWCINGRSTCFNPWKLSALQVLFTPGILPKARKASPAKSLAVRTSWSITVKRIIAPGTRHCSKVTELPEHKQKD